MKLLMENWRKFLMEDKGNRLWVVAGPPGSGKTTGVENPVKALKIPGLIVQDMDYIPAVESATESYMSTLGALPEEERYTGSPGVQQATAAATPKAQAGIDDFIRQHTGNDILLVGIAWLGPEKPFSFPENAQKMFLFPDPKTTIMQKQRRDAKGEALTDQQIEDAVADLQEEKYLYKERGWKLMAPTDIVTLIKSAYVEEPDETPI
jgi:hypothetical protein